MATEHSNKPPRRLWVPFGTLLVATAIAVGLATGIHSLSSATNASSVAAVPSTAAGASGSANRVTFPASTQVVPSEACEAMDATAFQMYCGPARGSDVALPRAAFPACEAMDATAYRMYCSPGDGGRWITGSEPDSVVH